MADSDDTTTLPSVTRRHLLLGTMATTAAWPLQDEAAVAGALADNPSFDPALLLWHQWKDAFRSTAALCRKQQRLETKLIGCVGFPQAEVYLPDEDVTVTVSWLEDIEELFGDDPAVADIRVNAEADLAAHQARWNEADAQIGYSSAKRAEQEASDREQDVFDTLTHTPATSLAGVAGKLDAILREGESWEDCSDFPWPQVRSVLVDVVRIGQMLRPNAFMPGSERKGPYQRRHRDGCCFRVWKAPEGS
ncbi:hypothetical protein [Chelativorans salis]|uniref:Twin-arginine translocation pathway signal n=1 Tax=Chelativorans salis TaxID=2978478 RepID=A0ABT2LK43_9HYPH|nr:hypothetical protein [Chelativorans sp. EGI FJ00035]MCT7374724.1 hypothetical protein [Chelativorans sp. EGI FJ00035]